MYQYTSTFSQFCHAHIFRILYSVAVRTYSRERTLSSYSMESKPSAQATRPKSDEYSCRAVAQLFFGHRWGARGWVRKQSDPQPLDGPFSARSTPIVVTKSSLKDSTASKAAIRFKTLEEI